MAQQPTVIQVPMQLAVGTGLAKKKRYPDGRHCMELNAKDPCRCKRWASGKAKQGERVSEMCVRAGREFRIGKKVLKP